VDETDFDLTLEPFAEALMGAKDARSDGDSLRVMRRDFPFAAFDPFIGVSEAGDIVSREVEDVISEAVECQ
jgi:hypothetical protein